MCYRCEHREQETLRKEVKGKMGKGRGGKPSGTGRPSGKGRDNQPPK